MHRAIYVLSLASLATLSAPLAMAQSKQSKKIEATNLPDHPFQVGYPSASQLNLHLRLLIALTSPPNSGCQAARGTTFKSSWKFQEIPVFTFACLQANWKSGTSAETRTCNFMPAS